MIRKSDYAFWTFLVLSVFAAGTTVFNVTMTQSATKPNADLYRQHQLEEEIEAS